MKKLILLKIALCTSFIVMIGQNKIKYTYDKSGNRINKKEIPMSTKSTEAETAVFTEQLSERIIKIYPNPTRGFLKVELSDFENVKTANLVLLNMQGQIILKTKMTTNPADLDISTKPNGIYILQIHIDGKISAWKIIKE